MQPQIKASKQLIAVIKLNNDFLKKKVDIINNAPQMAPHFIHVNMFKYFNDSSLFPYILLAILAICKFSIKSLGQATSAKKTANNIAFICVILYKTKEKEAKKIL